jgi:hypothetical protein
MNAKFFIIVTSDVPDFCWEFKVIFVSEQELAMLLYYTHHCVVVSMPIIVSFPSKSLYYIYILVYFQSHKNSTYSYKAFQMDRMSENCTLPCMKRCWIGRASYTNTNILSKYQTTHDLLWSFICYEYEPYNWLPKWVTDIFENAKKKKY